MTDDRPGAVLVLTNSLDATADVVLRILAERRVTMGVAAVGTLGSDRAGTRGRREKGPNA